MFDVNKISENSKWEIIIWKPHQRTTMHIIHAGTVINY